MKLIAMKFYRFEGKANEWRIEGKQADKWLTFQHINLIVGKNASGKSRLVDNIHQLALLLRGSAKLSELMYDTSSYHLKFDDNNTAIEYILDFKAAKITQEILIINGIERLNRAKEQLYYEGAKAFLEFKTDDDILALSRRDTTQQPFFEPLYLWAKNFNFYEFGKDMGRHNFIKDVNAVKKEEEVDLKADNNIPQIFTLGQLKFKNFAEVIRTDMNEIGYNLQQVDAAKLKYISIPIFGIGAMESDREDMTDQREMSQGMFRALSLLVQLNYSLLSEIPSCIIIDDIGEGLDFERSKSLIDLIINKVKKSAVQVIMTTNDRFVMNKIPLEYWSIIQRLPQKSVFYNYQNSKATFDDFKYTGLSNFDFLSSEFYIEGFETEKQL